MPTALLSVSDKSGLVELARALSQAGFSLVSTGGTYRVLSEAGVDVRQVADLTGFPEILDGRVKTLHPAIHGGILARSTTEHSSQLDEQGIEPIDVVVVNLYPFRETAAKPDATFEEVVEQIDIGGPAMLRAAAKNFERVWVVVDAEDYPRLLEQVANPQVTSPTAPGTNAVSEDPSGLRLRRELAFKAFSHTATYDAAVGEYFARLAKEAALEASAQPAPTGPANGHTKSLPHRITLELEQAQNLRYGENPHQQGARYRESGKRGWWDDALQHKGSELSYLNLFDAEAAWRLAFELGEPACTIIKHANPCGVAVASDVSDAYEKAFEADPKSAFGGVVALNRPVSAELARSIMAKPKADVLLAPGYSEEALEVLGAKRKALRVLEAPAPGPRELEVRRVAGGLLIQEPDELRLDRSQWRVVTSRNPSESEWRDLELAWLVCARTSSNAIVLVAGGVAVGIGAGQQSRVDAAQLAASKAAGRASGGACASDAFYPFRDGLDAAAEAGVAAVIQPGGSVRDDEVVAAAEDHGLAMVLTGRRHFRH